MVTEDHPQENPNHLVFRTEMRRMQTHLLLDLVKQTPPPQKKKNRNKRKKQVKRAKHTSCAIMKGNFKLPKATSHFFAIICSGPEFTCI